MVRVGDFDFGLKEFAGALADFGPLNPFLIGYVALLGLDPFGLFFAMGLTNVILGLVYRLPLPVEAKKAIGAVALSERWRPSQIYLSGTLTGIAWLFLSLSRLVRRAARATPTCVVRGVQLGLMLILLKESLHFMWTGVALTIASIVLVILLLKNEVMPSGIAIFLLGLTVAFLSNPDLSIKLGFHVPQVFIPSMDDLTVGLLSVVVAQIVLTFSNAVMATCLAVNERFPRKRMTEENLAMNMGWMNTIFSFFGGAPMCHGAGGFSSQYFFGARTGGAMVMEGTVELLLALFLADSVVAIFAGFPLSVIGVMLLFACIELGKSVFRVRGKAEAIVTAVIGIASFLTNLAVGFFSGMVIYYTVERFRSLKTRSGTDDKNRANLCSNSFEGVGVVTSGEGGR